MLLRSPELEEAARRRIAKRLYLQLPDKQGRKELICRMLSQQSNILSDVEVDAVCDKTKFKVCDMNVANTEIELCKMR